MPKSAANANTSTGVLVAAQDPETRAAMVAALKGEFQVTAVASAHEGEQILARGQVGVLICDDLLADMSGLEWLAQLRRRNLAVIRVLAPQHSSEALAIAAINEAGVFRYIREAHTGEPLRQAINDAIALSWRRTGPPCMRTAVERTIKAHTPCSRSETGCVVAELQAQTPLSDSFRQRLGRQIGWTGMGLLSMSAFLLAILLMGIGVLTLLYVFKSMLGIDLIPNWHLTDWFR